jgi:hypothetical protein
MTAGARPDHEERRLRDLLAVAFLAGRAEVDPDCGESDPCAEVDLGATR